ncbi:MAG: hypothetical protein JWP97_5391 [Labilithrix sp.]|nr:hypothetical protein [Labilithrix sp.]
MARPTAARATSPREIQKLAHAAAVEELTRTGITEKVQELFVSVFRTAMRPTPEHEAKQIFTRFVRAFGKGPAREVLDEFAAFSMAHQGHQGGAYSRAIAALGGIDGPVRRLLAVVDAGEPAAERSRGGERREMVVLIATNVTRKEPLDARRLALLSILAGVPTWDAALGRRPGQGFTAKEAIAAERRAMAHHLKQRAR